jgi:hypothetical protein
MINLLKNDQSKNEVEKNTAGKYRDGVNEKEKK